MAQSPWRRASPSWSSLAPLIPATAAIGTDLAYSALTKLAGTWQHWRQGTVDVRVVHAGNTVRIVHPDQPLALDGRIGDLVTLLPIGGDAIGVTTAGLRWPLDAATLHMGRSRGLSNEIVATPASVSRSYRMRW